MAAPEYRALVFMAPEKNWRLAKARSDDPDDVKVRPS